jgi:hypothetical protein
LQIADAFADDLQKLGVTMTCNSAAAFAVAGGRDN